MRRWPFNAFAALVALAAGFGIASSAEARGTNAPQPIDLATTLRLAGAQNLDVHIARERLKEARAYYGEARMQFLPWLAPGLGYRRHDGNIQDVSGNIFDTSKQSYNVGAALTAQVDLGDAIYKSLAAHQLVIAAEQSVEAQRRETVYAAAGGYFDLARAQGAMGAARTGVQIAEEYAAQVRQAVEAGLAFKGDEFRAVVQVERNRILLHQADEQRSVAAARLAQTLRLPPTIDLMAQETELAPLTLVETNAALDALVARALAARPELQQLAALRESSGRFRAGVEYGPLIPTLGAQAYYGGLGGGKNDSLGDFDHTHDYLVGLSWKVGPGGLFDRSRLRAAEARERTRELELDKARDDVIRQVVEAQSRARSLGDQLASAERTLAAAEQVLRYSRTRKEFGIGVVLEAVQAEQELTRARLVYLDALAEHNKAQFAWKRAVGQSPTAP